MCSTDKGCTVGTRGVLVLDVDGEGERLNVKNTQAHKNSAVQS